jgi:hypothetical protein
MTNNVTGRLLDEGDKSLPTTAGGCLMTEGTCGKTRWWAVGGGFASGSAAQDG